MITGLIVEATQSRLRTSLISLVHLIHHFEEKSLDTILKTYLHLCADNDVVVLKYNDTTEGSLKIDQNGGGSFTIVTLKPIVEISKDSSIERALELHEKAHELCFIASSCNFKIAVEPQAVKSN